MRIGIVGLPLSGKTTVFNALTGANLATGVSPGGKREPNIGVVKVPDERLERLNKMLQPERKVPATVEYVDVAGLKKGASRSGEFGPRFLNYLKAIDALLLVVRAFQNESVPHPEGSVDPKRDIELVETEFLLSDLGIVENRIGKLEKSLAKKKDEREERELGLLKRCYESLAEEMPLREEKFSPEEEKLLRGFQFLTLKPLLILVNIGEEDIGKEDQIIERCSGAIKGENYRMLALCAELEMELTQLEERDAQAFRADLGMEESALTKLIKTSYELLGLISFFTTEGGEVKAWTIRKGTPARRAAGAVHTDMEKGFIRAEVVHYDDLIRCGSIAKCREQGLFRLEGKDYLVQDGDVITFRFSV